MYHIGDLKKFVRCPLLYYLSRDNETSFSQFLRTDESTVNLLKKHLHIDDCFVGETGDDNEAFFKNKDKHEWFINTRFNDAGLRIKVPVIHKDGDKYDLYFIYHGTSIKELDVFYYSINLELINKIGIDIDDVYIATINGDYVFDDCLDTDELFNITDHFKGKRLIDIFSEEMFDYKDIIKRIESTSIDSYSPKKTRTCHLKNICPYYYECFKEEKDLPDDSILSLVSSQYKDDMYKDGIIQLKDADLDRVEGNRLQYAQIKASQNGGLFVDKLALKEFLNNINKRPISFVDFEWDTYLIPRYKGMKALDVIPFEYALYVLDKDSEELKNYSFVGNGDCRREFLEGLLEKLPKEGPILAYNAYGAECKRLKELEEIYPEYSEQIEDILSRFVDLAIPFLEGIVYDIRMGGNFTLKRLVNVVSNLNYKDLDICDGMDAVYSWRGIDRGLDVDEQEIVEQLIKYCSLDAYGLYLVYKWLYTLI